MFYAAQKSCVAAPLQSIQSSNVLNLTGWAFNRSSCCPANIDVDCQLVPLLDLLIAVQNHFGLAMSSADENFALLP